MKLEEPSLEPKIFGMPLGANFAHSFADEVIRQYTNRPPEDLARVEIYVNTARMRRQMMSAFQAGPAMLLPRIRLITDLANDPRLVSQERPSDLRNTLELTRLVRALLDQETSTAPRSALFDLTQGLFSLMDEMHSEGIHPDAIFELDVSSQSGHWQQSLAFIQILKDFFDPSKGKQGKSARLRQAVEAQAGIWQQSPPEHPVVVAGTTGSREAGAMFVQAVADLPLGTVLLPGFDFDMKRCKNRRSQERQ